MRMDLTGTCSVRSAFASLALSAAAITVGMVTMTNSVVSGFLNRARASSMRACKLTTSQIWVLRMLFAEHTCQPL